MKRLTAILVAGIFVLAPLSASAMEMMSDSSMKDVTGQAGVSIAVDDVVLYQESVADTTYWDNDGNAQAGDTEAFGVSITYDDSAKKLTTIDAILDTQGPRDATTESNYGIYSNQGLDEVFSDDNFSVQDDVGVNVTGVSALTIDVGTANTLTAGYQYNQGLGLPGYDTEGGEMAGVIIGLPTVEITNFHTADSRSISLHEDSGVDGTTVNAGAEFIEIEQDGSSRMAILGGTVEIAPH